MGHSYAALYYHVVFGTKHRKPQIDRDLSARFSKYIGGIVRNEQSALLAAGGMPDHVHLLLAIHPTVCVADLVRLIKTNSSKWIHETWPTRRDFTWQSGYAAFTVSRSNLDEVRSYLANQEQHHHRLSFEEEFVRFLQRHDLPYDERYVWE
jgi:putative transposase